MDESTQPVDPMEEPGGPALDATRAIRPTGDADSASNPNVDPSRRGLTGPGRTGPRYTEGSVIGRGGMGEIHTARDRRIGRSVAIKVMLEEDASRADAQRRFLREARVQGQLEHPSVVPVYDLDWDEEGRAYFAMKRIAGVTLSQVLRDLRIGNAEYETKYSLRRLLSNFLQVCLTLEYAHSRGVVHRDIKPSNIMFGDFGEVYVLDWGIAKLAHGAEIDTLKTTSLHREGETSADEVLGTIGYMAPEQMTSASEVDARTDVYSLGAVLFYILTLEPLHGRGNSLERSRSTREGADARASRRAPDRDIPPELDAICVRATALDPNDRYPSARALHDAVEAYLEGDRDLRLRAELAEQHVDKARDAIEKMHRPGADPVRRRKRAIAEAGRALALDPKNEDAAGIVARLMLEAPTELPPEVEEAHERVLEAEMRDGVRLSSLALFGVLAASVFLPLLGAIRSYAGVAVILGSIAVAAVYGLVTSTFRAHVTRRDVVWLTLPVCVAIAGFSLVTGPIAIPPVLAMGFCALIAITHWLGSYRIWMIAATCAAWVVPAILDWIGVGLPPAYSFENGTMVCLPRLMELPEAATRGGSMALYLAATIVVSALLLRYSGWVANSRSQLQLNQWHLESLLPLDHDESPRSEAPPPPADPPPADQDATRAARAGARERSD